MTAHPGKGLIMNTYKAFYNGKERDIESDTSYHAQLEAIRLFNPPKSRRHQVTVILMEKDGQPTTCNTAF